MDREKNLILRQLLDPNLEKFILELKVRRVEKSSELALKTRLDGNKLYCSKLHSGELHAEIFNLYTKCIALAPLNSEELALGYSNRSALLLHLKKYSDSLKDIERSLLVTTSNSLKVKLFCRKVEALTALGCPDNQITFHEAIKFFERVPENHKDKKSLTKIISRANLILQLNRTKVSSEKDSRQEFLKTLSKKEEIFSYVDVKYSKKFGRHLVAIQDFKPGDIVYIEKPYAVCSNLEMPYFYCYHCLNVSWTGVACNFCSRCIFCSEKCREEAWKKYHDIECLITSYTESVLENSNNHLRLAVKILIMTIKEGGSIEKLKKELADIDDCKNEDKHNFFKHEKLKSNIFKTIYILEQNVSKKCLKINVQIAGKILACIIKYTSFFGTNLLQNQKLSDVVNNEDVLFAGALLLKVFNITSCNRYNISGSSSSYCGSKYPLECLKKNCSCCKGIFLMQMTSFINNSCVPNVRRCFVGDNKVVIYALQPIEKNSQIFTSYLCSFYDETYVDRKVLLKEQFFFTCNCVACERDWPSLQILSQESNEEDDSLSNAKKSLIEKELIEKYGSLIRNNHENNSKIDNSAVANLSKGIEEATKFLSQPNTTVCVLTMTLQIYFERLYSHSVQIFQAC